MQHVSSDSETTELIPKVHIKDRFNLVYLIIFCTGVGILIPWNYFINAKQYFHFKLIPRNGTKDGDMRPLFENYLTLFSMIPMAVMNVLNLFLRRHVTPMRRFNVGVSVVFLIFLLTLVLTKINTIDPLLFFWITMATSAILNVCCGLIQGSALGIVSMMPARYIKGFMEGMSLSGVLASVSDIITISASSQPQLSAFLYFILAMFIVAMSGVGFCSLGKLAFSREFICKSTTLEQSLDVSINVSCSQDSFPISLNRLSFTQRYFPLLSSIRWFALSTTMTFLVTLSVFPSFTSSIKSCTNQKIWKDVYFTPVVGFLLFNLSDYFGRFLCGYVNVPSKDNPKTLFMLSMLRWFLVPLIFICNSENKKYFRTILNDDVYPIILIICLGASNGYLLTLGLLYAPCCVEDDEKEAVGTLMSLFLCMGLSFGVAISYLFTFIV